MRLTRFTDLSLRVLMYLTYRNRSSLVTVNELAERFNWSRNHIVKVAHFLSSRGWIKSYRGRLGGLELSLDPAQTRLGDLVRTLEGDQPLLDCENPLCTMIDGCQFRHLKEQAYEAFYETLNAHTLASLTEHPEAQKTIARLNEHPMVMHPPRNGAASPSPISRLVNPSKLQR